VSEFEVLEVYFNSVFFDEWGWMMFPFEAILDPLGTLTLLACFLDNHSGW